MSLDFYLYGSPEEVDCECKCGNVHKNTEYQYSKSFNITHNLGKMAGAAGIYEVLWHPDEMKPPITKASGCIPLLEEGLKKLKQDPTKFEKYNAPNGWGMYQHLVPFVEEILTECKEHPDATVETST